MTADEARRHLRYSRWASERLLSGVMALPEEMRARDLGCSHKGVMETLQHVLMADRVWLARVCGEPQDPTPAPVEAEWARVQDRWAEFAAGLIDPDLGRVIQYRDL